MPFLICNTTEYVAVTNGKIRSVSDISLAKIFEGEGEAKAFLATLAPYFKNRGFAVAKTKVKPNVAEVESEEAINIGIEKRKDECFLLLDKAQSVVTDFDALARIAKSNKDFAAEQLSICDRSLTDVLHRIELGKFNACEGYKLASMIQDILIERRKYKDFIYISNVLVSSGSDTIVKNNVIGSIRNMDNRGYTPRELPEIFQNNFQKPLDKIVDLWYHIITGSEQQPVRCTE